MTLQRDDIDQVPGHVFIAYEARRKWLDDARPNQVLPKGDWDTLMWLAGRFYGKTRALVEPAWWEAYRVPGLRVHALAPTLGDVRRTMFEGNSGFLARMPAELVASYNKSDKEIRLTNGSLIAGFACVEEADRLRGPQCHTLIFDEAAAADRPAGNLEAAWRVAVLGCRLPYPDGSPSRKLIATTPRPIPFLKRLAKRPGVIVIRGTSYENLKNVSTAAANELLALEGTSYGRQEIYGDFIDEEADTSILKRHWFKLWPVDPATGFHRPLPPFDYVIESYDTAASEENYDAKKQQTDPTASIVLGIFNVAAAFSEAERKKMKLRCKYGALLLESWSERLGLPELLDKAAKQRARRWGPKGKERKSDMVLIEDKSSGPGVRQFMSRWGVPVMPVKPRGSKAMRTHAVSPIVQQGMIWVPESMRADRKGQVIAWADEFMEQVTAFAGEGSVEHDDYVDALVGCLGYLRDHSDYMRAEPEQRFLDYEDKLDHDREDAKRVFEAERRRERGSAYG